MKVAHHQVIGDDQRNRRKQTIDQNPDQQHTIQPKWEPDTSQRIGSQCPDERPKDGAEYRDNRRIEQIIAAEGIRQDLPVVVQGKFRREKDRWPCKKFALQLE